MLLLTAKATREIMEAIEANTEALKRIEGKIDGQTEIAKDITRDTRDEGHTERRQAQGRLPDGSLNTLST